MTTDYYDTLETRDPEVREADLFAALRDHLRAAMRAPAIARLLDGVDPDAVTDRGALADLPVIRKSELMALQGDSPPFGGLTPGAGRGLRERLRVAGPDFRTDAAPCPTRFAWHARFLRRGCARAT